MLLLLLSLIQGSPQRDDGQWAMPARDYAATRYSGLNQITPANAARLKPVWTFSTGVLGGHEGQPLVVDKTMYVVTPFPNVLYAFDLTQDGFPLKWKYRPDVNPASLGIACCDGINRGAVYADGKIIYNLLDGHTVAVDAADGHEVWKTQIADINQGETTPMAPFVAGNRVIVGPSGGEFGIWGWVKGLDLATGKILWTAHNMGPDSAMLARAGTFRGTGNLGVSTWEGDAWRRGGAPVWGWISYDPQLDLIYFGTGNPGPYNTEQRPGENKWTNSVTAGRVLRVWGIKEEFPFWGGSVVAGGHVVFYGTLDGWFKAVDARNGRVLWKQKVGSGVVGAPISFRGADGKQYIAVYAGIGGDWFLLSGDVRSDDPADVRPPADFAPNLARHTSQGGIVWVFGL